MNPRCAPLIESSAWPGNAPEHRRWPLAFAKRRPHRGKAGLLAPESIERVLREVLRREAFEDLLSVAERVEAAGISSMSMDEINAEIQAYRGK